ncbi:MAG: Arginine ABC transporter, periplasmic arginine-binding protein ArtJ [uncultured bacterium]|nr:MAG: Arginine ABC transporter, periplasmic arginine-binding protein ArtJ [uncultured bacterium]
MKKLLIICFSLIIATTSNALAKPKQIKFCVSPGVAPFVMADTSNKITGGLDIDLAKALCEKTKSKCIFAPQKEITTIAADLESGKCDAWISGFTITPIRKKYMDFTDSYYPSTASLIASKNSSFTSSNKDLKGKKIGVTAGSNFVSYLDVSNSYDIEKNEFINEYDALAALKSKKLDAVIADTPLLHYWMQQKGNKGFRLIDLPEYNKAFSLGMGYGIPVKKGNTKLLTTLNRALAKIKADGTYDKIVKKYFADQ